MAREPHLEVRDLTLSYGERTIQRDLSFTVLRGDVFIVMGGSGCGKSTVLRALVGLKQPSAGRVTFNGLSLWELAPSERDGVLRRCGILYQSGALWSSMTLAENVALPLQMFTALRRSEIREIVSLKLALVGLSGSEELYPHEISGGMRKRAGVARAVALDPEIIFLDEPSAGLDPVTARRLDELILALRESTGLTVVVVTHDLASIFTIGDDSVFLDAERKTIVARGPPKKLLVECRDPTVHRFLTRGEAAPIAP